MSSGLSASATLMAALLLLLGGAAHANEADETLRRLTAQAREQVKVGDPKALAGTLGEIVKTLPEASPDGVSDVTELEQYLATPGVVERSSGSPPPETSSPPGRNVPVPERSDPGASSPGSSPAPAASAMSEPREQPPQPVQAPRPEQPEPPVVPPSKYSSVPARTAAATTTPAPTPAPAAQTPAGSLNELTDLLRRRGDSALQTGDISGARRFFQLGAEIGCGACAASLARTFDADQLRRMGTVGITPDPAQAEAWRVKARQLGQANGP